METVDGFGYEAEFDRFTPFSDEDDPTEVDATFRLVRRIAIGYFILFMALTLGAGIALVALRWASTASIFGGFTPGFVLAGFGLYFLFVLLGAASSSLINGVEDRMLGSPSLEPNDART